MCLEFFMNTRHLGLACPNTQLQQMNLSWHKPPMAEAAVRAAGGQVCARHSQHLCAKGLGGHREESCVPR